MFTIAVLFTSSIGFGQVDGDYCPGPDQPGDEYADSIAFTPSEVASGTCAIEMIWADIDIDDQSFKLAFKIGNAGQALFRIYIDSDNDPTTGLTSDTFGGQTTAIAGAEYILEIEAKNNGTTTLYEATGPNTYEVSSLGGLVGANGDSDCDT
ncbi:MAG TPA: hypothetical protein VGA80_07215, partial [Flavobacteriaceae bacterium]